MLYLLDADVLIRADNSFYRPNRFPEFWDWLVHMGKRGAVKIPREQYEEITAGKGGLVEWLKTTEVKEALLLNEDADPTLVAEVTLAGYGELDDKGVATVGRDPFLIAYAYGAKADRTVVTFEVSSPGKKGANRKIPDVCGGLGVACCTLFVLLDQLDFTTGWKPD